MPDLSNMIPAPLTGKPFGDLYLYSDPPLWEAYIACARFFDMDSPMDVYFPLCFPDPEADARPPLEEFIVFRNEQRIVTQVSRLDNGERRWASQVTVYYVADPPTGGVAPEKIGLPPVPKCWEPIEGRKPVDTDAEGLKRVRRLLGDQGLVGVFVTSSAALGCFEDIVRYHEHPELHEQWAQERVHEAERRFAYVMVLEEKPDFIAVGGSGTSIFQTPEIFRQLAASLFCPRAISVAAIPRLTTSEP